MIFFLTVDILGEKPAWPSRIFMEKSAKDSSDDMKKIMEEKKNE